MKALTENIKNRLGHWLISQGALLLFDNPEKQKALLAVLDTAQSGMEEAQIFGEAKRTLRLTHDQPILSRPAND